MFTPLPRSFYEPSAEIVAPLLLGHWLLCRTPEGLCGGPIVETEAYLAEDPASHSYGGERARNRAMFGEPGHAYVYLIYGLHCCFNTVCAPQGRGEAVLVRALEPSFGGDRMQRRRAVRNPRQWTSGPAKLCAALSIDRRLDGTDLCDPAAPVFLARNPDHKAFLLEKGPMLTGTRIGISKAADWPLRFCLAGSPWVSRPALGRGPRQAS